MTLLRSKGKPKIYTLIGIIGLLFFASSCRKKAEWNSDWVFPLVKDSLTLQNYINDSILAVNSDNTVQVKLNRRLKELRLSDLVKIPDTTITQDFHISVNSLTVNPGTEFVNKTENHQLGLKDAALTEMRIKTGKVSITLENPLNTAGIFTITLPGVSKNGQTLSYTKKVKGGTQSNPGIGSIMVDLSGYTAILTGKNNNTYNTLQSKLTIKSPANASKTTVYQSDIFKAKIQLSNLTVDYAKGYLGKRTFSDTLNVPLKALNNVVGGNINIDKINLDLIIKNGVKVRGQGKITLFKSTNPHTSNTVSLHHPFFNQYNNIDPTQGAWNNLNPSSLTFHFDNTTGSLIPFLENLGNQYKIGYSILLNPLGKIAGVNNIVYPKSSIDLYIKSDFPLQLGADSLHLVDTFQLNFKNENKVLRIKSGNLVLNTVNSFPYGAKIHLIFLDASYQKLTSVPVSGEIHFAQVDNTGEHHIPREDKIIVPLNQEQIDKLPKTKYIKVSAKFNSTTFTNNAIFGDDALYIQLMSHFKLNAKL